MEDLTKNDSSSTTDVETTTDSTVISNDQEATDSGQEDTTEQTAIQTDSEEETDTVDTNNKQKESRARKRINQLTREKYELRSRIEALENTVRGNVKSEEQPQYNLNKPSRELFSTDEDYIEALTDWKLQKNRLTEKENQLKREVEQKSYDFQVKENLVAREIPDYFDVIEEGRDVRVNQAAIDAIVDSPIGPHLRYYLAKNPEEAESTLRMKPHEAVKFIGRLESKLEEQLKGKAKQQKTKISNAPAPLKTPKASSNSNISFDINDTKISAEEWIRKRNEMKRKGL